MKICLACEARFEGNHWKCPVCGFDPERFQGFLAFAPEVAEALKS